MVTTTLETYFWMVDRLGIEDDTRNKVNMTRNTVVLGRPFIKRLENGHYVGRLLNDMYQTYSQRTDKQFELSAGISEVEAESPTYNHDVWRVLFENLAKFGVEIGKKRQDIILQTQKTDYIVEIMDALFEIDQHPQGSLGAATRRRLDIRTKFGEKKSGFQSQRQAVLSDNQSEGNSQISPSKSPLKMPGSVRQRRGSIRLAPIDGQNDYNRQSIQVQKQAQQRLLGREQSMAQEGLSANDLDEIMPTQLEQARTSVQFILTSISNAYEMKPKQAAALLANNHKVLQHLCIKGGKGSDFTQVQNWYQTMQPQAQQLVHLINTEKKDIMSFNASHALQSPGQRVPENRSKILHKTLNILKSGLYSRNHEVQLLAGDLFVAIVTAVSQQSHEMMMDTLDWFLTTTLIPEYNRSPTKKGVTINDPKNNSLSRKNSGVPPDNDIQLSKDIEHFQYQTGLQALYYAYQTNIEFVPALSQILLIIGRADPVSFFTQQLPQQAPSWSLCANLQLDVFTQTLDQPFAIQLLESSGVVKSWAQVCHQVFESTGEVPYNDRVVSIIFLSELWRLRPLIIENALPNASQTIVRMLKRAARDMQRTLVVIAVELLFRLLETFAKKKHHYAPNIYKTLTFLLVEFYYEVDMREMMLGLFINLFKQAADMPVQIVCEPLFKQIELSQYHITSFNVFDFEFFKFIANHQKLTLEIGLQMMETLTRIALASVFYQQPAIKLIEQLMMRFAYAVEDLQYHWQTQFKNIMQGIVSIQARLVMHRIYLRNEENNFFNRLALRGKQSGNSSNFTDAAQQNRGRLSDQEYQQVLINERLMVNLCCQIFYIQFPEVNEELKYAVLDTYIGLQAQLKIESKALRHLIKLFTNKVDAMIDDWQIRYPNKAAQLVIPQLAEIQELMRDNTKGSIYSPGAVDIYQSTKRLKVRNITSPKMKQTRDTMLSGNSQQVSVALQASAAGSSQNKNTFKSLQNQNHLYDFNKWEEQWEVKQYMQYLKRNQRLYKQLHYTYSTQLEAAKKPHAVDKATFAQYEKTSAQINAHSLFRMLKDFKLEFGQEHWYLLEEVKRLIKQINIFIMKEPGTVQDLTFEGFVHFVLQYSYFVFVTLGAGTDPVKKDEIRALTLVEKLFSTVVQQPKFKELNLTLTKTETTNRVEVALLQKLDQKFMQHGELPGNHKIQKEKAKFLDYLVPQSIPIPQHKKMCIEIMDEILNNALGIHFLEPIAVEKQIVKVLPKVQSIRTTSMVVQHQNVNPKPLPPRGLPAHRPLSYGHALSMEQDVTKQEFLSKHERRHSVKPNEGTSLQKAHEMTHGISERTNFKAQAINRRAKQFGEAMQLTIINEPMPDKQTMFEAAEVLNEVIKAIEGGKKALRLDFTPYRLYDMYKKKLPKAEEPEPVIEEDEEEKEEKKRKVANFMEQENLRRAEMKQKMKDQRKQQLLAQEKEERLAKARDHEYQERKQIVQSIEEKTRAEREKQKQELAQQTSLQQRLASEQAREKMKERIRKNKEELQKKEHDRRGDLYDSLQQENQKEIKVKNYKDRWSTIHKKKLESVEHEKTDARDKFYDWCKSDEIQQLVNKKYKLGLWERFAQALKMSKSISGVNVAGWIEYFRQTQMFSKIEAKRLVRLHATQVKEMGVVDDHQYNKVFYSKTREGAAIPGDRELSYGAFVVGIIKASNLYTLMEQEAKGKPFSQVKFPEYGEYQFPADASEGLEAFLDMLKVSTQENNVAKPTFQTTPYTQKPPVSPLRQK